MDPEIRNFAEIEKFIKESPEKANALAFRWEEFITTYAKENPEVASIKSREEFLAWAAQHPEKHIDINVWLGKEITDVYLRIRQEDSVAQAQGSNDKKEERQREGSREIPEERVSQPAAPSTTQQPRMQTPTRGFFDKGIGRGTSRLGGRLAGRTGSMAGRLASRLTVQAGMAAGRGVVAGAVAIGSTGWIIIGLIIGIGLVVFLIIMLAGGGGIGGGAVPTVDCADENGNPIVVFDGNECATSLADYYSNQTGTSITATCLDKCSDVVSVLCDRNAINTCTSPDASCGTTETFCIQYSPAPLPSSTWLYDCNSAIFDYTSFASCSGSGIITPIPIGPTPTPGGPTLTPTPTPAPAGALAFPGAEGWGAVSVGGRGGRVIEVTTLADGVPAPAGSLRACVEASGTRICVFRVGGTIELVSILRITNPYLTIAGQTAPGGGILLRGFTGMRINAHDVIIRYLRVRLTGAGSPGGGQVYTGIGTGGYNVILDHCSGSWTLDEGIQVWKHEFPSTPDITNITVQRCVMAEGLAGHGMGMLIGGTDLAVNGDHLKVHEISAHHNLFVHNYDRNPRVSSAGTQIINNLVYNWGSRVGVSARDNTVDFINNYWKPGPMSGDLIYKHESTHVTQGWIYPDPSIYILGNIVQGRFDNPAADNWPLIVRDTEAGWPPNTLLPLSYRRSTPLPQAPFPIAIQSATDAYTSILADAGANARLDCQGNWVPNSDAVDQRVIADVENGTGPSGHGYASPQEAGGFPNIASGTACADTDHDGMPDEWESTHSLNPNDPSDNVRDTDADGYLNIEEFLNGTAPS